MGLFEKSLKYLSEGYYTEGLKGLGRRIGRSKKFVEGSFEEAETFVPKAKGGYGPLRDVRPAGRPAVTKSRRGGLKAITPDDLDAYLESRIRALPEEESTTVVERWAEEHGKAPLPPQKIDPYKRPKRPSGVLEEWEAKRAAIQDYPTRHRAHSRKTMSVIDLEPRVSTEARDTQNYPLGTGTKINRGASRVGRVVEKGDPVDFRSEVKYGGTFGVWEEPPMVKKSVGISDAQWQRYLQRIADRTPSQSATRSQTGIGPGGIEQTQQVPLTQGAEAATQAMGELAPEQTRLFSRLREPYIEGGMKRYKNYDLPYTEAVERFTADMPEMGGPGKLEAFEQYLPPADVMSIGKEGTTSFERRKFQPVGKRVEGAIENIRKALPALERKGKKIETPVDASELVKMSMVVDNMWKFIKGLRSVEGKMWQRLSQSAKGLNKASFKGGAKSTSVDPRQYFNRTALKWLQDKKSVRDIEAKMLEDIWDRYNKSM